MGTSQDLRWRKSSFSGSSGGECIEVADLHPRIAVRDSKNPAGPVLTLTPSAFAAFVEAAAQERIGR